MKSHGKNNVEKCTPFDVEFYESFIPDYTSCQIFIEAVGYDLDSST